MKKFFIGIIGFLLFNVTVQAESYDFSLIPYNVTNVCEFTEEVGGQECFDKMLDGELEEYKITDNKVSTNDIIMTVLYLKPSLDSKISDARIIIDTNPEVLIMDSNEFESYTASSDRLDNETNGILPTNNNKTSWKIIPANYLNNSKVLFYMSDSSRNKPIIKEGNLAAIFYKVSNNTQDGTTVKISYNEEQTQLSNNSYQKINHLANYGSLTLTVSNRLNQIESNVYTIKREEGISYIYGSTANTSILDYLENFKNPSNELHVFDAYDNEIIDKSKYITTKMKIKLIKNNEVEDELIIIVKGDINCDGDVTVSDNAMLQDYTLMKIDLEKIESLAADVTNDGNVNASDRTKLQDFILMKIDSLN